MLQLQLATENDEKTPKVNFMLSPEKTEEMENVRNNIYRTV